jgi:2-dehydropantoate 2-reductase
VEALPGEDTFRVGAWVADPASALKLEQLVSLFALCGLATRTDNLRGYRWMKLALNAMANPLLLLSGLTASELHSLELARRLMAAMTREVLAAAEVSGAQVEPPLGIDAARWVSRHPQDEDAIDQCLSRHGEALGTRRLSMVADFQARGQTEVDHINGFVVRALQSAGLPARLNQGVVNFVHEVEAGRRPMAPDNLRELALLMPDTFQESLT